MKAQFEHDLAMVMGHQHVYDTITQVNEAALAPDSNPPGGMNGEWAIMPLKKSSSNAARNMNIRREIEAKKPIKQAVAIGYAVQREAKKKKRK